MTDQPEALRLADALDPLTRRSIDNLTCAAAAAELRRLAGVEAERLALLYTAKFARTYLSLYGETAKQALEMIDTAIAKVEGGGNG